MTTAPCFPTTTYLLVGDNLGPFATVFPYDTDSEVLVFLDLGAGPVLQVSGPDYTLTDTIPQLTNGGSVMLDPSLLPIGGWPAGLLPGAPSDVNTPTIILLRKTPNGQPSSFGEDDRFSPQQWEAALDALARQIQDVMEGLARTVQDQAGPGGWQVPDEIPRALHLVGFDQYGAWTLYPLSEFIGAFTVIGAPYIITFGLPGAPATGLERAQDHPLPFAISLPADFLNAIWVGIEAAPTGDTTIAFEDQHGTAKGQIVIHPDSTVAAVDFTATTPGGAAVVFNRGDVFRPKQTAADATLAGWSITLKATITG